jgi:Fic family protein
MYIYQYRDWPKFSWDKDKIQDLLSTVSHRQGRLIGSMENLGFNLQSEAILETMTLELLKSNEIEGELLDRDELRSSIARKLGIEIGGLVPANINVEGVVEVMLDATQKFREPLTADRLFSWHSALFPGGRSGLHKIVVGSWRDNLIDDPMQVVSGPMGKEHVHFKAPDSTVLDKEMTLFLHWFNESTDTNALLKAAIAHLWFVTIHPFDDGNGRLARTLTDMLLARADGISKRFYSMSAQIRIERKQYYDILEKTQYGSTDITDWIIWFLECLNRALIASEADLSKVLYKARFWDHIKEFDLNDRQRKMINKILDDFEGKLTSSKWAKMCKCSQDTAGRDIQSLISKSILVKEAAGGRSTSYILAKI